MRKALYFSLLAIIFFSFSVNAQQTALGVKSIESSLTSPSNEIKPPKLLYPTSVVDNENALLFRWEKISLLNTEVIYEFVLSNRMGLLYSFKTPNTSWTLDLVETPLVEGENYSVTINSYISELDRSYILYGQESALFFDYEPKCSAPKNVQVSNIEEDFLELYWEGSPAIAKNTEYRIRYRPLNVREGWSEFLVTSGSSARISNIQPVSIKYEIQISKICYWRDGSSVFSEWVEVSIPTKERPTLPPFNCGASYSYSSVPCTPPLTNGNNVTTIFIGGFPIEVQTLTFTLNDLGYREWSGTGLAPLPFGETVVQVEWTDVQINSNFQICQGEVLGVKDLLSNYPDLNLGPVAFGGDICVPPPSTPGFDSAGIHNVTGLPWDPNGFGPNGLYVKEPPYPGYQPGFPYDTTGVYDPNGFDHLGINAITGTLYNTEGCSAEGVDSLGQPCNPAIPPYSWMDQSNNNPSTQAGLEFVSEMALLHESVVGLACGIWLI